MPRETPIAVATSFSGRSSRYRSTTATRWRSGNCRTTVQISRSTTWATAPGGSTVRCSNAARRIRRRTTFEQRRIEPPAAVAQVVDREIWTVVQQLPQRQRVAVVLRYLLDLPEKEVATAMGISRGTVASALAAARQRLAAWLTAEEASNG